ncbi:hypothetical protein Bbelb_436800 [Branchiostoma belcheri]|nr:hypothetical protein Bbelb_436800 [Branchiostoma belcheri]
MTKRTCQRSEQTTQKAQKSLVDYWRARVCTVFGLVWGWIESEVCESSSVRRTSQRAGMHTVLERHCRVKEFPWGRGKCTCHGFVIGFCERRSGSSSIVIASRPLAKIKCSICSCSKSGDRMLAGTRHMVPQDKAKAQVLDGTSSPTTRAPETTGDVGRRNSPVLGVQCTRRVVVGYKALFIEESWQAL